MKTTENKVIKSLFEDFIKTKKEWDKYIKNENNNKYCEDNDHYYKLLEINKYTQKVMDDICGLNN